MIQIAVDKLTIADEEGCPCDLDLGLLEKNVADAFRHLGFRDVWMAQDLALTVEEKIRGNDATLMSRQEVDDLVVSVLNASGFTDVAREYSILRGINPLESARSQMAPWDGKIRETLKRSLPLTNAQLDEVTELCRIVLQKTSMNIATDKFLVDLAVHLIINNSKEAVYTLERAEATSTGASQALSVPDDWRSLLNQYTRDLLERGVIRVLPVSQIFPRARISIRMQKLNEQNPGAWNSSPAICEFFTKTAPYMLETLRALRNDLSKKHPLLADSPSHLLLQDFMEFLSLEPKLWKKRYRDELLSNVKRLIEENVIRKAGFDIALTIK